MKTKNITHRKRLIEIDILTGIAIVLVVLGHLASSNAVPLRVGNSIYFFIKSNIYLFHMPLFMFLSGSIFYYTYNKIKSTGQYLHYIKKKSIRLLPGLFLFGSIMIFAKIFLLHKGQISYSFFYDITKNYFQLLFAPMSSMSRSLWYIYVLMEYYIVFPLLLIVLGRRKYLLIAIGLFLYAISTSSHILAYREFTEYFIFFSLGILFIAHYDITVVFFKKFYMIFIILFIFSFFSSFIFDRHYSMLFVGFFSIPAFYSLVLKYFYYSDNIFGKIGKYTFSIYLMNTLVVGTVEVILLKYMKLNDENFTYIFPIIFILGVLIPILIRKYIFSNIPILDKITR